MVSNDSSNVHRAVLEPNGVHSVCVCVCNFNQTLIQPHHQTKVYLFFTLLNNTFFRPTLCLELIYARALAYITIYHKLFTKMVILQIW